MYTSLEQFKEQKLKEFDSIVARWEEPKWVYERHEALMSFMSSFVKSNRTLLSQAIDEAAEATVEAVYGGGNTIATTLDDLKSTDGETTSIIRANIGSWLTPTKETL